MITLNLHADMAEKYGSRFTLDVKSPAEMIHALEVQLPGFRKDIEAGSWHVIRDDFKNPEDPNSGSCDEDSLLLHASSGTEIHLLPAVQGAGGNGVFTTILGVVLIVVGAMYDWSGSTSTVGFGLIAGGVGLVAGGIVQMTMKTPGADPVNERADDRASFLFNGPRNQSNQGVAIPRGYGRAKIGSIVISAGLYAEDVVA